MRHRYSILCLVLLILACIFPERPVCAQGTEGMVPDSTELRALRQFYYATQGDGWVNKTNWLQGTTVAQAGNWFGVTVTNGDVTGLYGGNNNLRGTLPASLGLLTQLQQLRIFNCRELLGPLPAQLGQLHQLSRLEFVTTGLSGPLPATLSQLTQLTYLSFYNSHFSGPIPAWLGNLVQLTYLNLGNDYRSQLGQYNTFTGEIPASLGQLTQLTYLEISISPLQVTIPPELGNLTNLTLLELDGCQLKGPVPASLRDLVRLNNLILNNNDLTVLPSWQQVPNPRSLALNAGNNQLDFGSLERNFTGPGQHPYGQFLYSPQRPPEGTDTVRFTPGDTLRLVRGLGGKKTHYQWERQVQGQWQDVTGATDSTWVVAQADTSARGLYRTRATNEWATGVTITSKLVYAQPQVNSQLQALRELYEATDGDHWTRHDNWPSGDAAWKAIRSVSQCQNWFGLYVAGENVRGVYLGNNHLHGQLPASIGQLRELDYLLLPSNELSGLLPYSLGDLGKLTYLYLDHNQFTGFIPPTLGKLPVLQIGLHNNRLTGPIPSELEQLPRLESLYLMYNELTGPFPAFLTRMTGLQDLWVGNNQLTGSLPESIGQLTRLRGLGVNNNRLSGAVPASLLQLPLQALYVSTNAFTDLPSWVGAAQKPGDLYVGNNELSFAPLEKNFSAAGVKVVPEFYYQGQRTPAGVDTMYFVHGTSPILTRSIGGANNVYQWERKQGQVWTELPGITGTSYQVATATDRQEGEYRVRVTNTWVTELILYSKPVYLSMRAYEELPYNEPTANCPPLASLPAPTDRPISQTDTINYVRTYTTRTAITNPADLQQAAKELVQVQTAYVDGLGRPVQTVLQQQSPTGRDVVQFQEYDELGRPFKQYLPYTAKATADAQGYYPNMRAEQDRFYRGTSADPTVRALTATLPKTASAFSQTVFEPSPLDRPRVQAGAGESWMLSSGNVTVLEERPNVATDSVQRWIPGAGYSSNREDLVYQGSYPEGELWVKQTRDENRQFVQEFTDKLGHVVLKQVALQAGQTPGQWLKTYYLYDAPGQLRAVLPPKAVQLLRKNPLGAWLTDGAGIERLIFRYRYDARGRMIEKKVPDTDGYQYVVYDELDHPILTQDVAQQARQEWVATKYDALGRVAYTALVRFTKVTGSAYQQRQTLQDQADQASAQGLSQWEEPATTPTLGKAYYTHRTFPDVTLQTGAQLLSVNFYDGYDYDQNGEADAQYRLPKASALACPPDQVPQADSRVTGQLTRTITRVLGRDASLPTAWLTATSFFDEKLRLIQAISTNARGGTDTVSIRYDFTGQVLVSYTVHRVPDQPTRHVREQRVYDHAGRLLTITQELEGATPQVLARHRYNELGQLETKRLGGALAASAGAVSPPLPDATAPRPLQTVDYRYNIRGWLTKINDVNAPDPEDLWSFSLHYDCGFNTSQFNGNIAGQTWRSASDGIERAYGYRYDAANRLLQGDYITRANSNAAAPWAAGRSDYRFWGASYDANGNLLTLRRRGLVQATTRISPARYAETDNLRYRYTPAAGSAEVSSNRLLRVDDMAPAPTSFGAKQPERPDFSDGTTAGSSQPDYATQGAVNPDYTYDAAGSLLSDQNKGITRIAYNYLHLPELIEWSNGNQLQYVYTATGQKVGKVATTAPVAGTPTLVPVRTDYLGAWQYERDSLRWLTHAEGRALVLYRRNAANGIDTKVQYEFTLKDHLGNLRVAFHPGEKTTYMAMMDSNPTNPQQTSREQHEFDSLSVSAPIRQVVGQQFAHGGDGVALLNAGGPQPRPLGPLKQLAVAKNDTLVVTAFGMYQQPLSTSTGGGFSLASFVASLLQQPTTTQPLNDGTRRVRVLPLLSAGLTAAALPALVKLAGGVPQAYLRVLVFDRDSVLIDTHTQQLSRLADASVPGGGYEQLQRMVIVPQAGYVQAYVANESDTDVFFDDITVEHRQGLQVQENHYDPFGLDLAGLNKKNQQENLYTFNGQEKQTDFDLQWYGYKFRQFDPQIARFLCVDPLSDKFPYMATYQFASNSPIWLKELEGLEGVKYTDANGTTIIEKNVVVLTRALKVIPKGATLEQSAKIEKQNLRITRSNNERINTISSQLNTYFNGYDGKGAKDLSGSSVKFKFNVSGVTEPTVKGLDKETRNSVYNNIGISNSLTAFNSFSNPIPIKAAVVTYESSGSKYGSLDYGSVIRINFGAPEGAESHEVLHSLGPPDNGYNKGGLLNSPPEQINSTEVSEVLKNSFNKERIK